MVKERELGWLEGIIDGEGCIYISKGTNRAHGYPDKCYWILRLIVTNTNLDLLNKVREIIGEGSIYHRRLEENKDRVHQYVLSSNGITRLLPKLKLVAKERQRMLAIEAAALLHANRGGTVETRKPNNVRLEEILLEMRSLNAWKRNWRKKYVFDPRKV